jgi:hypothetical protein
MSEQVEITIKIPVSYFEKLRLESIASGETTSDETVVATNSETTSGKNEFMNIVNQLPDMAKNMLPKDVEKMSKDEQKTFVITLTKNYPQMKEMVSEKMINDLSSYFQCKAAELGFVKKFKYQQESPAAPAALPSLTASQTVPATPAASQTTPAVPQMQDMFAGLMGMMKPPAPLKEGETPPPQPSMQDFLAGFMGMMQQNTAAAAGGSGTAATTGSGTAATATGSGKTATVTGATTTTATTNVASIEEAD